MSATIATMLHRFDHVTVRSTDIERSSRFYQMVLELEPGPRPAFEVPGCWLYLHGQPLLHVVEAATGAAGGVIDHFAFVAADLPAMVSRLAGAGVAHEVRAARGSIARSVFLRDPDGARIELVDRR